METGQSTRCERVSFREGSITRVPAGTNLDDLGLVNRCFPIEIFHVTKRTLS